MARVRDHLSEPIRSPSLTFIVSSLRRGGQHFDLDNLIHPVLAVLEDPIDSVSARLYIGEPAGVLIEDALPGPPPVESLRTLRLEEHPTGNDRARPAIAAIAQDRPYVEHDGIGLALLFDGADIPIRRGWYGPTEAVIDDLRPWLGTYTVRALTADHRIRDLRITRGIEPRKRGVTISVWYVRDEEVHVPDALQRRIERATG